MFGPRAYCLPIFGTALTEAESRQRFWSSTLRCHWVGCTVAPFPSRCLAPRALPAPPNGLLYLPGTSPRIRHRIVLDYGDKLLQLIFGYRQSVLPASPCPFDAQLGKQIGNVPPPSKMAWLTAAFTVAITRWPEFGTIFSSSTSHSAVASCRLISANGTVPILVLP